MSKKEPRWYDISLPSDSSIVGKYCIIPGKASMVEVEYRAMYRKAQYTGSPLSTVYQLLRELYREAEHQDG